MARRSVIYLRKSSDFETGRIGAPVRPAESIPLEESHFAARWPARAHPVCRSCCARPRPVWAEPRTAELKTHRGLTPADQDRETPMMDSPGRVVAVPDLNRPITPGLASDGETGVFRQVDTAPAASGSRVIRLQPHYLSFRANGTRSFRPNEDHLGLDCSTPSQPARSRAIGSISRGSRCSNTFHAHSAAASISERAR